MARHTQLTLENLKLLDFGKIGVAFNAELEHVVKDCMDRPGDLKPREVCIRFKMIPRSNDPSNRDCDHVAIQSEITSKVPSRRTKVYEMIPNVKGHLLFNPDLPDEPDGTTLFEDQERKEDVNE